MQGACNFKVPSHLHLDAGAGDEWFRMETSWNGIY